MTERTREAYEAAFEKERRDEYPVIDAFEKRMGFAVERARLEAAARVLACPIKKNPPNWQHGRVIYALGRSIASKSPEYHVWLDIGTAKGFSAACMSWALEDAVAEGTIHSIDIIDPNSREPRNSCEDGKTVTEFMQPFIEVKRVAINFYHKPESLALIPSKMIGFAFVDGSHAYDGVKSDIRVVASRQRPGDVILFDDLQIPDVARAVSELKGYEIELLKPLPSRIYAIAVKQ